MTFIQIKVKIFLHHSGKEHLNFSYYAEATPAIQIFQQSSMLKSAATRTCSKLKGYSLCIIENF